MRQTTVVVLLNLRPVPQLRTAGFSILRGKERPGNLQGVTTVRPYSARQLPHLAAAKRALIEGFEAFVTGQSISANVHDPRKCPTTYIAWRAGWREAKAALRTVDSRGTRSEQIAVPVRARG